MFDDPDVSHVDGDVAPARDVETISTELMLADLQTLDKALPRLAKEVKFSKDAERLRMADAAAAAQRLLNEGTTLSQGAAGAGIRLSDLRELQLLTAKPFLYVFNTDMTGLPDDQRKELTDSGGAGRADLPRRQDRGGARRAARGRGGRTRSRTRARRAGAGPAGQGRVRRARADHIPDHRAKGNPGLDDPRRGDGSRGSRGDPQRLPAWLHQGRDRVLRRPGRRRVGRRRARRRERPASRARTTSCRTATWWSSASMCNRESRGFGRPLCRRTVTLGAPSSAGSRCRPGHQPGDAFARLSGLSRFAAPERGISPGMRAGIGCVPAYWMAWFI